MKLFSHTFQNLLPKTQFKNWLKALTFLIAGIFLTILATYHTEKKSAEAARKEFELGCNDIKSKISERFHTHALLLRSGSAFFAGSVTVSRSEWKEFNEHEKINTNLPGTIGVGFSLIIPKNKLSQHIQSIRNEGFPDYAVTPQGERDFYTSVIFIEPFSGRNLRAFGYDMFTQPVSRKAMEIARDSDIACLSGKVTLIQETNKDIQAGTLMYVPVYHNGMPINTLEQRRNAILGWVYSSYHMRDLMEGILGRWDLDHHDRIRLQVYDDSISNKALLYDSQKTDSLNHATVHTRTLTLPVDFYGKTWILHLSQTIEQGYFNHGIVIIVFLSGILISLLIFFLSLSIFATYSRALTIAEQLASDLKASETNYKKLFDEANDAVFIFNGNTFIDFNLRTEQLFRGSKKDLIGLTVQDLSPVVQPDGQDSSVKAMEKINAALSDKPQFFEWTHRRIDGTTFETEVSLSKVELGDTMHIQAIVRDITERNRSQKAIKESEVRYRSLFENSPSGILVLDKHGIILEANESIIQSSGYPHDELVGSHVSKIVSPKADNNVAENITRILAGENLVHEVVNRRKDGVDCIMKLRETAITLPDGQRGILSVSNDITGQKQWESSLLESEARFRNMADTAPILIWCSGPDSMSNYVNKTWLDFSGRTMEEEMGNGWIAGFHPVVYQRSLVIYIDAFNAQCSYIVEYRLRRADGEYRWLLEKGVPRFTPDGKFVGYIGSCIDINDRKHAETALKESENRLKSLFETMTEGVILINHEGQIVQANIAAERILGISRPEIESRNYIAPDWEILRIDGTPMPTKEMAGPRAFSEKRLIRDTIMGVRRPDGNVSWINVCAAPFFDNAGELEGVVGTFSDITDRKLAEDILAQTRQNYESFFNTIDDFLFVLDDHGNIIHTNATVIERLGYTREELAGQSVLMVHPPERREEAGRIVGEMLSGSTEFCPVPILTKAGVQIPVETRVSMGYWDGKPAIFGVTKDISKITLSEEKFSKLFYLNPSPCGLSDLNDHTYVEVNAGFYDFFGFEPDEVTGKTAMDLGILTNELSYAIMMKADRNGMIINAEADLKAKNGKIKNVLLSAENINVQDKKYRFTVVHDITAIKQAEMALQRFLSLTEATLESVNTGILVVSLQGAVIKSNAKFAGMWRIPDDILASGDDNILLNAGLDQLSDPDGFIARVAELYATPEADSLDILYFRDGRIFERISKPMYLGSEPKGRVWSFLDITERKRAEEEINSKNEDLLKLNLEKDKFFSIIAHDLRSPFNSLLGFTQLLAEELPTLTMAEIQKISVSMKKSAGNLFNLLENLLEWSRIQRGLTRFNPESLMLLNAVAPIIEMIRDEADKKMIRISYDIPEGLRVVADAKIFDSLIRNLVYNAVKFTPKGGEITIEAKPMPDNAVEISIKDTGIGMNKHIIENLFRLDEQTNRKCTEGEPSTGLGLIICKDSIEKHDGKLWVESEEGKGSTFRFTLPANGRQS